MQTRTLIIHNGHKVWATKEQAETMQVLSDTRKGGFARIYGYIATSESGSSYVLYTNRIGTNRETDGIIHALLGAKQNGQASLDILTKSEEIDMEFTCISTTNT